MEDKRKLFLYTVIIINSPKKQLQGWNEKTTNLDKIALNFLRLNNGKLIRPKL